MGGWVGGRADDDEGDDDRGQGDPAVTLEDDQEEEHDTEEEGEEECKVDGHVGRPMRSLTGCQVKRVRRNFLEVF